MRHKIRDNFVMLMSGNPLDDMVADRYVHKQVMVFIRISDPLAGRTVSFSRSTSDLPLRIISSTSTILPEPLSEKRRASSMTLSSTSSRLSK